LKIIAYEQEELILKQAKQCGDPDYDFKEDLTKDEFLWIQLND